MKKIYYLGTCDTCKRILSELNPPEGFVLQDIKEKPLDSEQLNELYLLTGSYEDLFSRRARLFRERGYHKKELSESDYKRLLLEHYTFLKRPVIVAGNAIFIGNSKPSVAAAKVHMNL